MAKTQFAVILGALYHGHGGTMFSAHPRVELLIIPRLFLTTDNLEHSMNQRGASPGDAAGESFFNLLKRGHSQR